jgi:uncharacterized coiled-coil DUF342 family protein
MKSYSIFINIQFNRVKEKIPEVKKNIKKLFEEKYAAPSAAKDEKSQSAEYFFKKLKF